MAAWIAIVTLMIEVLIVVPGVSGGYESSVCVAVNGENRNPPFGEATFPSPVNDVPLFDSACFDINNAAACRQDARCFWNSDGDDPGSSFCSDATCAIKTERMQCIVFPINFGSRITCKWDSTSHVCYEPSRNDLDTVVLPDDIAANDVCSDKGINQSMCGVYQECQWNEELGRCDRLTCSSLSREECTNPMIGPHCTAIEQIDHQVSCVERMTQRPDRSVCNAFLDDVSCHQDGGRFHCVWNAPGENPVDGICRGPCESRFYPFCGEDCLEPDLEGTYSPDVDVMCLNASRAPCDILKAENCNSEDSQGRCRLESANVDCPFSRCGRGSPCGERSNCTLHGWNSTWCCDEIRRYCGNDEDGIDDSIGYGGAVDIGDGTDKGCFQESGVKEYLTRQYQSSWGLCSLGNLDVDGSPDSPSENQDEWRGLSSCYNQDVMNHQSICESLMPRCVWIPGKAESDILDSESGFCTENSCFVQMNESACQSFNGGNACVWDPAYHNCMDGSVAIDVQAVECFSLSEQECAREAHCASVEYTDADGLATSVCVEFVCEAIPTREECTQLSPLCNWTTQSGSENDFGYCFNISDDVAGYDSVANCMTFASEDQCNEAAGCAWNNPPAEDDAWCGLESCTHQQTADDCANYIHSQCMWLTTNGPGHCVEATCEALPSAAECSSFRGEQCFWVDGLCSRNISSSVLSVEDGFECFNTLVLNNEGRCNAMHGCVFIDEECTTKNCYNMDTKESCTMFIENGRRCTWISAGEFCSELLPGHDVQTDRLKVPQHFDPCESASSLNECGTMNYCRWVPGGPGCRNVDMQCMLSEPLPCNLFQQEQSCSNSIMGCTWKDGTCVSAGQLLFPDPNSICDAPKIFIGSRYIVPRSPVIPLYLGVNPLFTQRCNQSVQCYSCEAVYSAGLKHTLPPDLIQDESTFNATVSDVRTNCCATTRAPTAPSPTTATPSSPPSRVATTTTTIAPLSSDKITTSHVISTKVQNGASTGIVHTTIVDEEPPPRSALDGEETRSSGTIVAVVLVVTLGLGGAVAYLLVKKKSMYAPVMQPRFNNPTYDDRNDKLLD